MAAKKTAAPEPTPAPTGSLPPAAPVEALDPAVEAAPVAHVLASASSQFESYRVSVDGADPVPVVELSSDVLHDLRKVVNAAYIEVS